MTLNQKMVVIEQQHMAGETQSSHLGTLDREMVVGASAVVIGAIPRLNISKDQVHLVRICRDLNIDLPSLLTILHPAPIYPFRWGVLMNGQTLPMIARHEYKIPIHLQKA